MCDIELFGNHYEKITVGLPGSHQINNAMLALAAIHHLPNKWNVEREAVYCGMAKPFWPGRIHQVCTKPNVVVDVSHNPVGFRKTFAFIREFYSKENIHCAIFLQRDKDSEEILKIISKNCSVIYVITMDAGKPFDGKQFANQLRKQGAQTHILENIDSFISHIKKSEADSQLWLVIGSHYLAGDFYRLWTPNIFST